MSNEESVPLLPRVDIGRNDEEPTTKTYGFFSLFRYSQGADLILMSIGTICAVIHGSCFPLLAVVFGSMTNTLLIQQSGDSRNASTYYLSNFTSTAVPELNFAESMTNYSIYYTYISLAVLLASFIQTYCWELACERQVFMLRQTFFSQMLRQDMSWYDCQHDGDLTVKLSDDLERVREGIGSKCSMVVQYVATFIAGISVGIYVSWKLTLMVLVLGPLLIGTSAYLARMTATSSAREQEKYAVAGSVAEQVLNNVRTVVAFGKEEYEIQRFSNALEAGRIVAMKKYWIMSVCYGTVVLLNYLGYGFTFWYGSKLTAAGEADAGTVFAVFFSVLSGAFTLGSAMPFIAIISMAVGAGSTLFSVIDRVPHIDPYSHNGEQPREMNGNIEFKNVCFSYPARPSIQVLNGINLKIKAGQKIAIVGTSGSGKSTIASLLLRLYDPTSGQILVDGKDVRNLNVCWLRSHIGVVTQEPKLFSTTIRDNIRYGHLQQATFMDVLRAAIDAYAHIFITKFQNGYDTVVGGVQLSGGEKQRVAIARALIRIPKVLILDEATSALDSATEEIVQSMLKPSEKNRTTITIAHRLSSVRTADCIYVLQDGVVVEQGTHLQLISKGGHYFSLVEAQRSTSKKEYRSDLSLPNSDVGEKKKTTQPWISSSPLSSSLEDLLLCLEDTVRSKPNKTSTMLRLLRLNAPEWSSLSMGFLGCIFTAAILPMFAVFYGEVLSTFTLPESLFKEYAEFWTIMFVVLAGWAGFGYFMQTIAMTMAAEHLVKRIRVLAFSRILQQSVSWLDHEDSSPHQLCARLARDAPLVKSAAGLRAGHMLGAFVTLLSAMGVAFVFGWKLAIVLIVGVPVMIFSSYQLTLVSRRYQNRDVHLMDLASKVASESIQYISTVQALGKERTFFKLYIDKLSAPFLEAKKQAFTFASIFAFCQAVIYAMYAAAFWCGSYLVNTNDMDAVSVFRVFFAIAFSAQSIGQTTAFMQDYSRAKMAAEKLFQLTDLTPCRKLGEEHPKITGQVEFQAVHFHYPTRPTIPVLQSLTLSVRSGQTLALVGASGNGKSTIMALLQQFYTPTRGRVLIDGNDIRYIEPSYLRRHMGYVPQEPILFDCSLRDNIAYGALKEVGMDQIVRAACAANIHDFINQLPQGYDTLAGNMTGLSQLSGGQKQRVAIARALVRNPCILLLDEATSALDAASEREVQVALDSAFRGRTCIIIAHRLSTIRNADMIAVIDKGQVVEQGNHEFLMKLEGKYFDLGSRQGL